MSIDSINWNEIHYFKREEFSEDPDTYASPDLIYSLDRFRRILEHSVYPSPVSGALARTDASGHTSRHYAIERKSDAIDVFCNVPIFQAWSVALRCNLWGGIGVYFDTTFKGKSWCLLHLDRRDRNMLWLRNEGKYISMTNKAFWWTLSICFGELVR